MTDGDSVNNQQPAPLRERDLRHPGRGLLPHNYCSPQGVFVSQSSVFVPSVFVPSDRTGKPVEKKKATSISFVLVSETRTVLTISFLQSPKLKEWSKERGKPVGESSSSTQTRTLFDDLRQMISAECCEKIGHHELQAARAEQERQILQEEL